MKNLRGDVGTEVLDGWQAGKRVATGEFDWTCETIQPLLKLGHGFSRPVNDHCSALMT
jgi:hypothetical protein